MNLSPVQKKSKVTEQVLAQIKNALMKGEFRPGERLPGASELAEKMGVGVSSVREAVKMLESMGAVESRQGEGTFIRKELCEDAANALAIQFLLLPQSADYLMDFREMYETVYTYLAMNNATVRDLGIIEQYVLNLESHVDVNEPEALVAIKDELDFHTSVLYSTHNPYVIKIGEASLDLFFNVLHTRLIPLKLIDAAADHRSIFEALLKKDVSLLRNVFGKSFKAWGARFPLTGR